MIARGAGPDELVMHFEGNQHTESLSKLHAPIDFRVADEAERDLSPLYLDMDETWRFGVYLCRAGQWWKLRWYCGDISLEPSTAVLHQPAGGNYHTRFDGAGKVLLGPDHSYAGLRDAGWTVWGVNLDETVIPVPSGADVLGLTKIAGAPALLTRDGDTVQACTEHGRRTVVETDQPVVRHYELLWVAVQPRSWTSPPATSCTASAASDQMRNRYAVVPGATCWILSGDSFIRPHSRS